MSEATTLPTRTSRLCMVTSPRVSQPPSSPRVHATCFSPTPGVSTAPFEPRASKQNFTCRRLQATVDSSAWLLKIGRSLARCVDLLMHNGGGNVRAELGSTREICQLVDPHLASDLKVVGPASR